MYSELDEDELYEIEEEPLIDLARASTEQQKSKQGVLKQLRSYLTQFIPNGFTEIKEHLFTNDKTLMYRAAHSQVTCTKMVGLYRLSLILDKMQKSVYTPVNQPNHPVDFNQYQALYHLLARELKKARSEEANMPDLAIRSASPSK